jgi:hypothetical protein
MVWHTKRSLSSNMNSRDKQEYKNSHSIAEQYMLFKAKICLQKWNIGSVGLKVLQISTDYRGFQPGHVNPRLF